MSWEETHRRWQALREVALAAEHTTDGQLPWSDEYAAIFGDRDGLVAALRYRWEMTTRAQLDTHLDERQLDERRRELTARNAGVIRVLQRYDEERRRALGTTRGCPLDGDRVSA